MKRRQPRFLSKVFLTLTLAPLFALAADQPVLTEARNAAETDRVYARLASEKGMPSASVEYFAPQGVAFAPHLRNGRKYWRSRAADFKGDLIWQPIFAAASRNGDLAYTTGPWEFKRDGKSVGFGHYLSIWSKQKDGSWKMDLDVGIDNPQPPEAPPALQLQAADATAGERPIEAVRRTLKETQKRFAEVARKDSGAAVLTHAAEEVRVYRDNALPALGTTAARLMLSSDHGKLVRTEQGSKLSSSADLFYSYGTYKEEKGNIAEEGIYVSLWRINLNGDWQLMLDLSKKIDPH